MASGNVVACGLVASSPGANAAQPDMIVGTSTPAEQIPVWDFDTTTVEYMDFYGRLEGYAGGGTTVKFALSASAAASGTCVPSVAIRRIADDVEDLDTTVHTYVYQDHAGVTAPSVIGEVTYDEIDMSDGAQMDLLADGDYFCLRFRRNTASPDGMAGDMELHAQMLIIVEQ